MGGRSRRENCCSNGHRTSSRPNSRSAGPGDPEIAPWRSQRIQIDTTLTNIISKHSTSPEIQKLITLDFISHFHDHSCIYTDGSKFEETAAAAVVIPEVGYRKVARVADSSSIYATELMRCSGLPYIKTSSGTNLLSSPTPSALQNLSKNKHQRLAQLSWRRS